MGNEKLAFSVTHTHPSLEAAERSERVAGHKRALAEKNLELTEGLSDLKRTAPVARDTMGKAAELVKELAAKAKSGTQSLCKGAGNGGNSGESAVSTDKTGGILGSYRGAHEEFLCMFATHFHL